MLRILLSIGLVAALAFSFFGCSESHSKLPPPIITQQQTIPQAKIEHDPWTATEGKILYGEVKDGLLAPFSRDEPLAPPGHWVIVSDRIKVWVPIWLDKVPQLWDIAVQEILHVKTESDFRIPSNWEGVDPSPGEYPPVLIIIHDPGSFTMKTSPTALARGSWEAFAYKGQNYDVLRVSWRVQPYETTPVLPALPHEVRHRLTKDPNAGH